MKKKFAPKAVIGLICTLLLVAGAAWFASYTDAQMQDQECALLLEQVRHAAVDCYASEGRYPQDLDYLKQYYGLIYDEERYSIMYDAFASNIMPDMVVSIRGEDE